MPTKLRILIVEDSNDDAELILREMRRGGYDPSYERVDSADALVAALDAQEWDVILSDYSMPSFSGTQALAIVRDRGLDVPFIFISGTIGEDMAVAAMKAGAQDYVTKGSLKRLVPAVERELREIGIRRARAEADAERRAVEARFGQILRMAADAIVAVDEDQRITVFNRAAELIFGYAADEVLGKPVDLLMPERQAVLYGRHLESFAGPRADGAGPGDLRGDVCGRRKSGEEFPVEASISRLIENGRTTFTAVIRDVSERRRSEAQLRQLLQAVEQSANLVIVTDGDGVVEYVNPRFLRETGYGAAEIVGREPSPWRFGSGDDDELTRIWGALLAGNDWRGEFASRRKDGSVFPVSATISPIRDGVGRITHFIGILEDVTERKEIEEQLRRSQRMEAIGQLTGGLAHDFNNLLTVVIGSLDMVAEQLPAETRTAELIRLALSASMRGADLTRQLLAFARRQSLDPQVCDLNRMIRGIMDLLRRTLGEQIEVVAVPADDLRPAFVDPTQVESALLNLAINARDAMANGGRLTIETGNAYLDEGYAASEIDVTPGHYVMLAVSDTGAGMTPETLARVFEPFFTTKAQGKGTGLGLSMVYGFVKQSRGHVRIYSEVGHGTTVRLYLPQAEADLAQSAEEQVSDEPQRGADEITILLVEDNDDVRNVVSTQLAGLGYRVIEAENAVKGLKLLEEGLEIDLMFSDIVMPGGVTGLDLTREARKLRPGLKVLLTSGFAEASLQLGERVGEIAGFLAKPYRKHELARRIREILAR